MSTIKKRQICTTGYNDFDFLTFFKTTKRFDHISTFTSFEGKRKRTAEKKEKLFLYTVNVS
jgi:hypothetical protein